MTPAEYLCSTSTYGYHENLPREYFPLYGIITLFKWPIIHEHILQMYEAADMVK